MENNTHPHNSGEIQWKEKRPRSGKMLGGLLVVLAGLVLLVHQADLVNLPGWLFSWQVLLIVIGLYSGLANSFRNIGWIFPVLVGLFFLITDLYPHIPLRTYIIPILVIVAGISIMYSSIRKRHKTYSPAPHNPSQSERDFQYASKEDLLDSVSVFGGVKKNIISKNFKGGEIVTIFGGAEYNLSHADIQGDVVLEVVQLFGGTRIIVPPHWEVTSSEMVAVLGSIEDKRPLGAESSYEPGKRLILKGVSIFGGIDLRSY